MRSEWGLIGNSHPSGSASRKAEVSAIHWFAASRLRRRRHGFAGGGRFGSPSGGPRPPARRSKTRAERARQTAPNPGASEEGEPEEKEAGRALRRRADGTGAPGEPVDDREGMPAPVADREFGRWLEEACGAARGGEHRHELKISATCGARLRLGAASRYHTAVGNGAWAARRRRASRGKTPGHGASLPKATHRRRGEGCAQNMVRAERNVRVVSLDERDHALLLSLLEHKVLTTHQIKSLFFRSFRRCQHRMKELKDLGLVSSFSLGRGFGEGRPPACWFLTKAGLAEIADAKDIRVSDLPWVPDHSYRSNLLLAHRLGVNAFFCALAEVSRDHEGHCLITWRPEHWVRTRAAKVKPDGFGRYLHPGGASEFYLEYDRGTEAFGALARKLEGYLRLAAGWTKEQELTGFRTSCSSFRRVCVRGRSAPPFATRSGSSKSGARSRRRSRCTWRARTSSPSSGSSVRPGDICPPMAIESRSLTCRSGPATFTELPDVSAGTSPTPMPAIAAESRPSRPPPDSAPCRPDMPLDAAARGRAKGRGRVPSPSGGGGQGLDQQSRCFGRDTGPDYACASGSGPARVSQDGCAPAAGPSADGLSRGTGARRRGGRAMDAVIYLRVSTKEQAAKDETGEGYSIPAQREACLRHIAEQGSSTPRRS